VTLPEPLRRSAIQGLTPSAAENSDPVTNTSMGASPKGHTRSTLTFRGKAAVRRVMHRAATAALQQELADLASVRAYAGKSFDWQRRIADLEVTLAAANRRLAVLEEAYRIDSALNRVRYEPEVTDGETRKSP
jgi:hypothetical protein